MSHRTAIIISGHMRTADLCFPSLYWHVFRHYPDAHYYISTVEDDDAHKTSLYTDQFDDQVKAVEVVPEQPDCEAEIAIKMGISRTALQAYANHAPYAISVPVQAVLAQLWQLRRAFSSAMTGADGGPYDVVIRCRPDLFFHSFTPPSPAPAPLQSITPWWGRFGGINDRFSIMGWQSAVFYFNTYTNAPDLITSGCPLHPESLIKASMEAEGIEVESNLAAEFSKVNRDGTLARPWTHEVLPCDRAPQ